VKSTAAQRRILLDEFERSSLSGPQFSQVAGVKYQTFCAWRRQRQKECAGNSETVAMTGVAGTSSGKAEGIRWVEAQVRGAWNHGIQKEGSLRIWLGQGLHVELSHGGQVPLAVALLQALNANCNQPC
jgi:hypothetical protein